MFVTSCIWCANKLAWPHSFAALVYFYKTFPKFVNFIVVKKWRHGLFQITFVSDKLWQRHISLVLKANKLQLQH